MVRTMKLLAEFDLAALQTNTLGLLLHRAHVQQGDLSPHEHDTVIVVKAMSQHGLSLSQLNYNAKTTRLNPFGGTPSGTRTDGLTVDVLLML